MRVDTLGVPKPRMSSTDAVCNFLTFSTRFEGFSILSSTGAALAAFLAGAFFLGVDFLFFTLRIARTSSKLNPLVSCFSSTTFDLVLEAISFTFISPAAGAEGDTFSFCVAALGLRPLFLGVAFALSTFAFFR